MFLVVRAKRIFLVLCLTIAAIGGIIIYSNRTLVPVFRMGAEAAAVYIIDAGHGGEDGGAVAQDGTVESDLNLAVARRIEGVLAFAGKKTVMTRRDENAVYDEGSATLREKKRSDLKNRAAQINRYDDAYLISIHQNSLPAVPSVHGAQVFYNAADGAETMAGAVQEALNQAVNQGNEKNEKAIDDSVYLMQQVRCPAVLIECGFLSNPAETQALKSASYQTELAVVIAAGVLNTTNGAAEHEES